MNVLYEEFPNSVNVCGKEYRIITDFREWIRFVDTIKSDLPSEIKMQIAMMYFADAVPNNPVQALNALVWFFEASELDENPYTKKEDESGQQRQKNILSYRIDGKYIYAAFLHDYGIDLHEAELHWWKFRVLLDGLSEENEIKKRIYYRSIDASQIKDKDERNRIRQIQRQIAIPQDLLSDYEIGNAFS